MKIAIKAGFDGFHRLRRDPELAEVRDDPEFRALPH